MSHERRTWWWRRQRHKSIYVQLTAYYIAVKCEWKTQWRHYRSIFILDDMGWREKKPVERFFLCFFSLFLCVMLFGVNHGNILLLQATRCTKFYDLRPLNLSNSDDFYILYYIFFRYLLAKYNMKCVQWRKNCERGIQRQLTTVQCCRQHDKLVVIQLEDWIHISLWIKRHSSGGFCPSQLPLFNFSCEHMGES